MNVFAALGVNETLTHIPMDLIHDEVRLLLQLAGELMRFLTGIRENDGHVRIHLRQMTDEELELAWESRLIDALLDRRCSRFFCHRVRCGWGRYHRRTHDREPAAEAEA